MSLSSAYETCDRLAEIMVRHCDQIITVCEQAIETQLERRPDARSEVMSEREAESEDFSTEPNPAAASS